MEILLNGRKHIAQGVTSLAELIKSLEIQSESIAVEHNEKVIPRKDLEQVALSSGDKVEIVRFVGGG